MVASCTLCGRDAELLKEGYAWCQEHERFSEIDPVELGVVLIWKSEGRDLEEMERGLENLLSEAS